MRTAIPDALPMFRSELQLRLLALLVLQPERWWTADELRAALDAPLSSVHRELKRIEGAGLLVRDGDAKPHRFQAAADSALLAPLTELLRLTVGVEDQLRRALDAPGVLAAAIHGSWAAGSRGPTSDIDVVVVGDADLRALRRAMREIGSRAGRRIDLTLFNPQEISGLVHDRRGFARHLTEDPTIPLVGDIEGFLRD